jgi:hypothetical protein
VKYSAASLPGAFVKNDATTFRVCALKYEAVQVIVEQ